MFIFQLQNNKAVAASSCTCCPHTLAGFQGGLVFCLPDRLPWISSRTQGEWLVVGPSGAQTLKNVHTWNPRRGRQGCVGHFDVWTHSGKPPHVPRSLSLKDIFLF